MGLLLFELHLKSLTGHGSKHIYYDELLDYVDATLNTQEDDIPNVLYAMMQNLPDGVMREGLKGHFSYTGPTLKDLLGVIAKKFDYEKKQPKEKMPQRSRLFPPPGNLSRTYNSNKPTKPVSATVSRPSCRSNVAVSSAAASSRPPR